MTGLLDRRPTHAEVVTGGDTLERLGFYLEPTVVANLEQQEEMTQREIFGPVMIHRAALLGRGADDRVGDGTPYGLASSVWTRDMARAIRVSAAIQFGCVWVNDHIPLALEMPHGGFKQSGYGKDLSMYALEDCTEVKHVMVSLS